jgi:hypothetical protein
LLLLTKFSMIFSNNWGGNGGFGDYLWADSEEGTEIL